MVLSDITNRLITIQNITFQPETPLESRVTSLFSNFSQNVHLFDFNHLTSPQTTTLIIMEYKASLL